MWKLSTQDVGQSSESWIDLTWPCDCAWERIHIDFDGPMEGIIFFIGVDAFSKCPEVVQMRTLTTTATIKELGRIFAQQGYPKVLVSDNGTLFYPSCVLGSVDTW